LKKWLEMTRLLILLFKKCTIVFLSTHGSMSCANKSVVICMIWRWSKRENKLCSWVCPSLSKSYRKKLHSMSTSLMKSKNWSTGRQKRKMMKNLLSDLKVDLARSCCRLQAEATTLYRKVNRRRPSKWRISVLQINLVKASCLTAPLNYLLNYLNEQIKIHKVSTYREYILRTTKHQLD